MPPAITLHRTGGIAGLVQHLYIYDDGRFVAEDDKRARRTEGALGDDEMERLWASFEDIGFFDLDHQYGLVCPDCFVYVITVREGERVKAVRTYDGSVPEELEEVLTSFVTLLDQGLEEE
jgi:hypothetical protein